MTRWNDYLATGNSVHHYRTRKPRRLSAILATIAVAVALAVIFASIAAEFTAAGLQ